MNNKKEKILMNSEEIRDKVIQNRKKYKLPLKGVASSNIRRQLKRLKDIHLIENIKTDYRITEFEDLNIIFEKRIKNFYLSNILERVDEYFRALK